MENTIQLTIKFLQYVVIDSVTFYKIIVTDVGSHESWFILKRYSELRSIHHILQDSNIGTPLT